MRNFKRGVAFAMAAVMTVSMTGVIRADANEESSTISSWKEEAVITPTEGKLVGAGYINVKVNTSVTDAESYNIVFDGKKAVELEANGENEQMAEVYTTSIAKHTLKVEAVLASGETVESNERNFFVSKKGIALGEDMSKTVELKKMNLSWYYNWQATPYNNSIDDGVDFVPMIWGRNQDDPDGTKDENLFKYIAEQCALVPKDANYILGYNEPELSAQANISVVQAQKGWEEIQKLGKRTVSPAISNPNGTYSGWLTPFLKGGTVDYNGVQIEIEGVSCDCVAIHTYISQRSVGMVIDAVKKVHELYGKPVWITEMGIFGSKAYGDKFDYSYQKPGENEKTGAFIKEVCAQLDEMDFVERYAWFPYNINSANDIDSNDASGSTALFDYDSGKLTDNGFLYASLGNPKGYETYKLTDADKYVYEEPTTQQPTTTATPKVEETTTQVTPTTVVPVETTKATTIGKVKIKSAKATKKKSAKVTWKKVSGVKQYQVQYSLNKKFKKSKIKKTGKLTIVLSKLAGGKKYFVRVRGINGSDKGPWSKTKTFKTSK